MAEQSGRPGTGPRGPRGVVLPQLKAWRLYRLMTQEDLRVAAGVGITTVIRAEHGQPVSLANVRKLAAALGVDAQRLMGEAPGQADTPPTEHEPAA